MIGLRIFQAIRLEILNLLVNLIMAIITICKLDNNSNFKTNHLLIRWALFSNLVLKITFILKIISIPQLNNIKYLCLEQLTS